MKSKHFNLSLTKYILHSLPIEQIYEVSKIESISAVEDEIERRLLSSNKNEYINTINLLYNKREEPVVKEWLNSPTIIRGLEGAIPWKIGVIYDYRDKSYRIQKINIIVGNPTAYMISNYYFKPSWLNSSKTKLTLREVINRTAPPINNVISLVTIDSTLDNNIRKALINNDTAEVTVCTFLSDDGSSFRSYDNYLPEAEAKQMYPCYIKIGSFEHKLIQIPNNIETYPQTFTINIVKSPEVQKLIELQRLVSNQNFP